MTKSEATRIRLTPHERAALETAAKENGSTVSEALRRAIRAQYMAAQAGSQSDHALAKQRANYAVGATAGA